MNPLRAVMESNDLGHPICAHLRNGTWAMDYIYERLIKWVFLLSYLLLLLSYLSPLFLVRSLYPPHGRWRDLSAKPAVLAYRFRFPHSHGSTLRGSNII
jgi:hypothetical protein